MFGFRLTRTQYKAANQRRGLPVQANRTKRTSRVKRPVPQWSALVNGRRTVFKEWTKGEVRALVKELTGQPLSVGFAIQRVA